MARPEKPIDWDIVEKMIEAQCTGVEIAASFNMTSETFYYKFNDEYGINFSSYSPNKALCGKGLIKLAQFEKALDENSKGSTQLLIWLGKVILGQREPDNSSSYPTETIEQLRILMNQISSEQSARKIEDNSSNAESKS